MQHLLDKMFRSSIKDNEIERVLPALPVDLSSSEAKQKAMVGWVARRVGQLLPLEPEQADWLFYTAFSYHPETTTDNELVDILYLAGLLVTWAETNENVPAKVKDMRLTPKLATSLIQVFEECREGLSIPLQQDTSVLPDHRDPSPLTHSDEDTWNDRVWQVYRDVMYAATQRKFLLISEAELPCYIRGHVVLEQEVTERQDVTICRENANKVFLQLGFEPSTIMGRLLVISEAVTNILKHAEYGKMLVVEDDDSVRVVVQDKGPGFAIQDLPNTTLLAGYSTKKSLGQGFTLMMKMSDQVLLSTSSQGSTIILVFHKKGDKG